MNLGPYLIEAELGRGGMGVVYRARHEGLGRTVALKVVAVDPERDRDLARFQREAQAAARLRHEAIVQVFDVGREGQRAWLAMELIEGPTLKERLAAEPAPGMRAIAGWIQQVAQGLDHAHEAGVIHRDVKPANILIDPSGRARLADFGLAKEMATPSALTLTGQILGTPGYLAPEQLGGSQREVDSRTDIYALGTTLFEALTGRLPFDALNLPDLLLQIRDAPPPRPRALRRDLPVALERVVLKALEKEPDRRYITAGAMARDLGRFLEAGQVRAEGQGAGRRTWGWVKRNPTTLAAAALLALLPLGWGAQRLYRLTLDRRFEDWARLHAHERQAADAAFAERGERWKAAQAILATAGRIGLTTGRSDLAWKALAVYEQALADDGSHAEALALRARTQFRLGEQVQARENLEAALAANPRDDELRYLLLRTRALSETPPASEALADFGDGPRSQALRTLAKLLLEGLAEPAATWYGEALKRLAGIEELLADWPDFHLLRASVRGQALPVLFAQASRGVLPDDFWRERSAAVLADLDRGRAIDPLWPQPQYLAALIRAGLRDEVQARALAEGCLATQPRHLGALRLLAILRLRRGEADAAAEILGRTGDAAPDAAEWSAWLAESRLELRADDLARRRAELLASPLGQALGDDPGGAARLLAGLENFLRLGPTEKAGIMALDTRLRAALPPSDARPIIAALRDRARKQSWRLLLDDPKRAQRLNALVPADAGWRPSELIALLAFSTRPAEEEHLLALPALSQVDDLWDRAGVYYRRGQLDRAEADLWQALWLAPGSGTVSYGLACVLAKRAGDEPARAARALDALELARRHGFARSEYPRTDPDFAALRGLARFQELVAP